MPFEMLRKSSSMSLHGFRSQALNVQRLCRAMGEFGQSSGRGLMAVEDEEVNVDGSGQVYVPCIWRAVSRYFPTRTSLKGQGAWYSTLGDLGSWISLLALWANVMRNFRRPG